jgi:hypothetical protein
LLYYPISPPRHRKDCCTTVPDVDYCVMLHLPDFKHISTPKCIFDAQMVEGTTSYWLVSRSGVGEARKAAVGHGSGGGVVV